MPKTPIHLDRLFVTEMPEGLDPWLSRTAESPEPRWLWPSMTPKRGFPAWIPTTPCLYRVVTRKRRSTYRPRVYY